MYSAHLGRVWRNHFRGTAAHNTITVDGRDQTALYGTRGVHRPARARCLAWATCATLDWIRGEHDGYLRLPSPVLHRRALLFLKPRTILILDEISGAGSHSAELTFHLHPRGEVLPGQGEGSFRSLHPGGEGLDLRPLLLEGLEARVLRGIDPSRDGEPEGWVAFRSGEKEPAPVISYRKTGPAPLRFATLLGCFDPETARVPEIVSSGASDAGFAVRLRKADGQDTTLVLGFDALARPEWTGGAGGVIATRAGPADGVSTDAILAIIERDPRGLPRGGAILEGTWLRASGGAERLVEVEGPAGPSALAWRLEGGTLSIETSAGSPTAAWARFRFPARGPEAPIDRVLVDGHPASFKDGSDSIRVRLASFDGC
jgi:hypothetical protein